MDSKMSVGLDTPISIGLTGQTWIPTPSPTLKLNTPTLEPLQVDNPDHWNNPLSAQPSGLPPQTSNPLNLSTGLTPRFSPGLGGPLASPGVSGEIANVPDSSIPNTSLSDLFRCNEYPFTSAAPPSAPISARQTSAGRPPFRPPQPPTPNSQPLASQPQQNKPESVATVKPPTSQPYVSAFARNPAQAHPSAHVNVSQQLPPPAQHVTYPQNPQPPHQSMGTAAQVMTSAAPHTNYPYQVAQNPSPANGLPPRPMSGVPAQAQPTVQPITPAKPGAVKPVQAGVNASGHRSVLGSGIVSSAVQEAQVRARMKAESFAKSRKRKRSDSTELDKAEKLTEEDAKLSPEELKQKRYQRRLALNRESAAVSRVRRREYVKLLEEQLVTAEKERVRLATQLSEMQQQHNKLQEHLQKLENRMGEAGDT